MAGLADQAQAVVLLVACLVAASSSLGPWKPGLCLISNARGLRSGPCCYVLDSEPSGWSCCSSFRISAVVSVHAVHFPLPCTDLEVALQHGRQAQIRHASRWQFRYWNKRLRSFHASLLLQFCVLAHPWRLIWVLLVWRGVHNQILED